MSYGPQQYDRHDTKEPTIPPEQVEKILNGNVFDQGVCHSGATHIKKVMTDLVPASTAEAAFEMAWTLFLQSLLASMYVYHDRSGKTHLWHTNHDGKDPNFAPLTYEMGTTMVDGKIRLKLQAEWDTRE